MSSRFSTQGISEWNSDEGAKELLQLGSCAYVLTNLPVAIFGSVILSLKTTMYTSEFFALRLGYPDSLRCHVYS